MTRMTAALVTAAVGVFAGAGTASAEPVILSTGHVDALDVRAYETGRLRVEVRDDTATPVVHRDPADVIFHAKPESKVVLPIDLPPAYDFLGGPGATVWVLPEVEDPNLLWPGWETNRLPVGMFVDDLLEFRLLEVDGPGQLHMWVTDPGGAPIMLFTSGDGLPDAQPVPVHTHQHTNWAFTTPGLYTLFFEVTGTLEGGGQVTSGVVRYRFFVGDLADLPELPETTLTIAGVADAYAAGETATLRAVQAPDTGLADYRWSARCGDEPGFTGIGEGATLAFVPEAGCRYRVKLYGEGDALVATSDPVTLEVRAPADPGSAPPPPSPPGPPAPPATPRELTLQASRARLSGRTLRLRLRLSEPSRVTVSLRRGGRTMARAKPREVPAGKRSLRVRLNRSLRAGRRYTVIVAAQAGDRLARDRVTVRVPRRSARHGGSGD